MKSKRTALGKSLLCFTALYAGLVALIGVIFAAYGKSVIWRVDGAQQHYIAFVYARQVVQSLLNGTFSPYTFAVGEGVDVLTTLNSYGLTDPFTYICLFFGENQQVAAYTVMTFAKMYAAGVACFFYIGNLRKKYSMETVMGALLYITMGYSFAVGFSHPNFHCGVLCLPLILLGVERALKENRFGTLVASVALLTFANYYALYMVTVMAGVVILVRVFSHREEGLGKRFAVLLRLAGAYLLGMGLAAVSLVPTAYAFLQNCRTGMQTGYTDSLFVFPFSFYKNLCFGLLTFNSGEYTTVIGLSGAAALLLLCFLFSGRKEWRKKKAGLIVLFVCMGIPLVGLVENGFGYVTNRWSFAFILMCSVCCSLSMEEVLTYKPRNKTLLAACACAVLYVIATSAAVILKLVKISKRGYVVRTGMVLVLVVGVFLLIPRQSNTKWKKRLFYGCIYATALVNAFFLLTPYGMNGVQKPMVTVAEVNDYATGGILSSAEDLMKEGFYRIECTNLRNEGLNQQKNLTSSWWSIMDKQRMVYYQTMELPTMDQNCRLEGLGANAFLTTLSSVRYYLPKNRNAPVPYGYTLLNGDAEAPLYENQYALPLGYVYSAYLTETEFMELPTVQKYQALTQAAVLSEEDARTGVVPHADYQTDILPVAYTLRADSTAQVADGEIRVRQKGDSFALEFEAPEGYEVYIRFGGLKQTQKDIVKVDLECGGWESSFPVNDKQMMWYAPMSGYTCKIADGKAGMQTCNVYIRDAGKLTYDTIELWAMPQQTYADAVEKLGQTVLNVEEMRGATIRGSIRVESPSLLNLSIPYVRGWTAYVDGEKANLVRTNTYMSGLMLESGEHTIELMYETPFLKLGMAVSALSVLAAVLVLTRRKRKGADNKKPVNEG